LQSVIAAAPLVATLPSGAARAATSALTCAARNAAVAQMNPPAVVQSTSNADEWVRIAVTEVQLSRNSSYQKTFRHT